MLEPLVQHVMQDTRWPVAGERLAPCGTPSSVAIISLAFDHHARFQKTSGSVESNLGSLMRIAQQFNKTLVAHVVEEAFDIRVGLIQFTFRVAMISPRALTGPRDGTISWGRYPYEEVVKVDLVDSAPRIITTARWTSLSSTQAIPKRSRFPIPFGDVLTQAWLRAISSRGEVDRRRSCEGLLRRRSVRSLPP